MTSRHPVVTSPVSARQVKFRNVAVGGLRIAYREAGPEDGPKLVLLHGFPSSSHQYRNLISALADTFHVIAPDYQGFGNSDAPDPQSYKYTFDALSNTMETFIAACGFSRYGLFVQDYGGPVGFRIATRRPEAVEWLIVQNSNAYEEGFTSAWDGLRGALWKNRSAETEEPLRGFLTQDAIKTFYLHGAAHPELISPDTWESDYAFMQRPHAVRMNLDLFYDYRTNVALYPRWQKFLRDARPKTQIFWGQDDIFFTPEGGEAFLRDVPEAELHRLAGGHFAIEDNLEYIADNTKRFYKSAVAANR
jgi:pimeloyl-ACP methyl ester carboxylesterase